MLFVPKGTHDATIGGVSHRHVLICDENRDMCKTIALVVNSLGYQAVAATDGSTAIRLGEMQTPDLIIIAENMPSARAIDFLDAGLGHLLTRRVLLIDHRSGNRPRWLPTITKPMEINSFKKQLSRLICDSGTR